MSGTKLEKAAPTGVATYDAELAKLYAAANGQDGTENIGREDASLPFLKILQALSPEVIRGDAKYIKGAEAGQYINSLTGEVFDFDKGVEVIRVYFNKKFIEWRPRDAGGGLVRISQTEAEAKAHQEPQTGNDKVDTYVNETHEMYLLIKGKYGWAPAVFSAAKSKLPFVRKWNGIIMNQKFGEFSDDIAKSLPSDAAPKPYSVVFTLVTASKAGKKGTYFIPALGANKRLATLEELKLAMEFKELIAKGAAKVEYTKPEDGDDVDAVPGMDGAA